jgi:hypothetical protein
MVVKKLSSDFGMRLERALAWANDALHYAVADASDTHRIQCQRFVRAPRVWAAAAMICS